MFEKTRIFSFGKIHHFFYILKQYETKREWISNFNILNIYYGRILSFILPSDIDWLPISIIKKKNIPRLLLHSTKNKPPPPTTIVISIVVGASLQLEIIIIIIIDSIKIYQDLFKP